MSLPETFTVALSTGYEVDMDLATSQTTYDSLEHLFQALAGEHFGEIREGGENALNEAIALEVAYLVKNEVPHGAEFLGIVMHYATLKKVEEVVGSVNAKRSIQN